MSTLIEFTEQIALAYDYMERGNRNILLTGRAGTGKSTLIRYFIETSKKNIVLLAPTGVAALNIGGQTIHSFFKFGIDITPDKVRKVSQYEEMLYRAIDTIVIDEISMVRSDLFTCIDRFMRLNGKKKDRPFGGAQMIIVGDIYQLPPVVTGNEKEIFTDFYKGYYFFDSDSFREADFYYIELDKIFRQRDKKFIEILNAIRNNTITDEQLKILNSRADEDFIPSQRDMYVQLTTTRDMADRINALELSRIDTDEYTFHGEVKGEFDESLLPVDLELNLKVGAQVMLLNNDPAGRWINGTLGIIEEFEDIGSEMLIIVRLENGEIEEVTPYTWKIIKHTYDREKKRIITEQIGSFTQYPLMPAWAITIHKSQGKTFEKVIIDLGRGTFAHGQLYVALSRCRSLEGLVLRRPVERRHIIMDQRVIDFITSIKYKQAEEEFPLNQRLKVIEEAIKEGHRLRITYLKKTDERSKREVIPLYAGEMDFNGTTFSGLRAIDCSKGEERNFRLDRIIDIEIIKKEE